MPLAQIKDDKMKKTILLITSLVFLTTIALSQSKENIKSLVQDGDKIYKIDDDKPFTGSVFDLMNLFG